MSYPVDPDSPLFVAKAIISSAALGAATGGVLGTVRGGNPFAFAINMGINGGVFSLTFFGLREYLISPLLLTSAPTSSHVSRLSYLSAKQLGKLPASAYTPSPSEVRTDRLLDSSISGFLTGSILSGSLRGVRTIVPAGITAGLVAGLLQYSVNEIRVVRLQLLARRSGGTALSEAGLDPGTQLATPRAPGTSSRNPTEIPAAPTIQAFTEPFKHDPSTQTLPARMMAGLSKFLPVRKLSDDEYMQTLKKREGEIEKRLAEIQVEELRFYEASLGIKGGDGSK